jgi:hydrogenase-4 component B
VLTLLLSAVALLGLTALIAALLARSDRASFLVASSGALSACALGVGASVIALIHSSTEQVRTSFSTALGPLYVGIDPLSSFFLLCVFLVSGLAALYGVGYLRV